MALNLRVLIYEHDDTPVCDLPINDVFELKRVEEINAEHALSITTTKVLKKGQRLLTKDARGKWREWVVAGIDDEHTQGKRPVGTYYCPWSIQHDLMGTMCYKQPGTGGSLVSAARALEDALSETARWIAGTVNVTTTNKASMWRMSAWEALAVLTETWGGEIDAEITVSGTGVVRRQVSLKNAIGQEVATRRFDWAFDLTEIRRKVADDPNVCRIVPIGAAQQTEDGYGRKITIESVNGGKDYLENTAVKNYYRLPDGNGGWEYPTRLVENPEIDDPAALKAWGQSILEANTTPRVTYEANVLQLAAAGMNTKGLDLGDAVQVVDRGFYEEGLRLQGRVLKITTNELANEIDVEIGSLAPTLAQTIRALSKTSSQALSLATVLNGGTTSTAEVMSRWLERLNSDINATGGYTYITEGQGIRCYDRAVTDPSIGAEATSVVEIKGGTIRIANTKTSAGEWEWKSVFVSGHIAANLITAAAITTGFIGSAGDTYINLDEHIVNLGKESEGHVVIEDDGLYIYNGAQLIAKFTLEGEHARILLGQAGENHVTIDENGVGIFSGNSYAAVNGVDLVATARDAENARTNMLLDWNAPSLTKVEAEKNRYFSDNNANRTCEVVEITDPPEPNIKYGARITSTGAQTNNTTKAALCFYTSPLVPTMTEGQTYTLSFWARKVSGTCAYYCQAGSSPYQRKNGSHEYKDANELTTGWEKIEWQFTYTAAQFGGTNGCRIYPGIVFKANTAGVGEVCGFRLVAEYSAEQAIANAAAAQSTASAANTAASNAQTTANQANTAAGNAQSTANAASTAASNAQTTANNAATAAATADGKAVNAQTTANNAATAAATADGKAVAAQNTANKNIKSSTQLWFTKANATAPDKPTAKVTSTSTAGNAWRVVVPAYNASYPYYFYCYQYELGDGTYSWSGVVYDRATTEAEQQARDAAAAAAAAAGAASTAAAAAAEAQTLAATADGKASATQQYFWADSGGVHVSTTANTAAGAFNSLFASSGLLFRKEDKNLLSLTGSALNFYDGSGNDAANVRASFGADYQIGKAGEPHQYANSTSWGFYPANATHATTAADALTGASALAITANAARVGLYSKPHLYITGNTLSFNGANANDTSATATGSTFFIDGNTPALRLGKYDQTHVYMASGKMGFYPASSNTDADAYFLANTSGIRSGQQKADVCNTYVTSTGLQIRVNTTAVARFLVSQSWPDWQDNYTGVTVPIDGFTQLDAGSNAGLIMAGKYSFKDDTDFKTIATFKGGLRSWGTINLHGFVTNGANTTREILASYYGDKITVVEGVQVVTPNSSWNLPVLKTITDGNVNGHAILIDGGGLVVIGGGEFARNFFNLGDYTPDNETLHLGADSNVYVYSNGQTIADRRRFVFNASGNFQLPYRQDSKIYTGSTFTETAPSSNLYHGGIYVLDNTDSQCAYFRAIHLTNGNRGVQLEARRGTSGAYKYNTLNLMIDASGNAVVGVSGTNIAAAWRSAIGAAAASSDRRLKKNIEPIGKEAVGFVKALQPSVYDINGKREVGLVAQDVWASDPWNTAMAYATEEGLDDWERLDGGTWKLDYTRIIPALVAALQDALARIEELEEKR